MAVPTVTQRPAAWAGTSGPILYKFLSTNYAQPTYRLLVQLFNGADVFQNELEFSANPSTGVVIANISEMIKAAISISADTDLTTSDDVYLDANFMQYYIKYQETWVNSSEVLTSDSANKKHAIYGGLQIGNTNDFDEYAVDTSAKKFLTTVGRLVGVEEKVNTISAIAKNFRVQFGGTFPVAPYMTESFLSGWTKAALLTSGGMTLSRTANDTVRLVGSSAGVVYIAMPITVADGQSVSLDLDHNEISGTLSFLLEMYLADDALTTYGVNASDIVSSTGSTTLSVTAPGSGASAITTLLLVCDYGSGSGTFDIVQDPYPQELLPATTTNEYISAAFTTEGCYRIKIPTTATSLKLISNSSTAVKSETKYIDRKEPCNEVHLMWKNTLGGDVCYPFSYNQIRSVVYGDGTKAKRLTLFAELLTLEYWEEIQDINSTNDSYDIPISEMLTTLKRTRKLVGQSINEIKSDSTQIGVVSVPQNIEVGTKQNIFSTQIIIDYPETFKQ